MSDSTEGWSPEVHTLLQSMDDAFRTEISGLDKRYEPFLKMLAGWKNAVHQHYEYSYNAAIARLTQELFPNRGTWRFPVQTLVMPESMPQEWVEITRDRIFIDSAERPWIPCGRVFLQPIEFESAEISPQPSEPTRNRQDEKTPAGAESDSKPTLLRLHGKMAPNTDINAVFKYGVLAFFALPEHAIAILETMDWQLYPPSESNSKPLNIQWYEETMAFERDMATARLEQRVLDTWLPAFYPYTRKIMKFTSGEEASPNAARVNSPVEQPEPDGQIDLFGAFYIEGVPRTSEAMDTLASLESVAVVFNPIPVVQAAVREGQFSPPQSGERNGLLVAEAGLHDYSPEIKEWSVFTGIGLDDAGQPVPGTLTALPEDNPEAPGKVLHFAHSAASVRQARVYYGSVGKIDARPELLVLNDASRYVIPRISHQSAVLLAPAVGGMSLNTPNTEKEWAQKAWYHNMFRPPLLSEGDIIQILEERQAALGTVKLKYRGAILDIVHYPNDISAHRRSYLWPSVWADTERFNLAEVERVEISAPYYVPMVQKIQLRFEPENSAANIPDYLLAEAADYLASVVSQYYVISIFRIEGVIV